MEYPLSAVFAPPGQPADLEIENGVMTLNVTTWDPGKFFARSRQLGETGLRSMSLPNESQVTDSRRHRAIMAAAAGLLTEDDDIPAEVDSVVLRDIFRLQRRIAELEASLLPAKALPDPEPARIAAALTMDPYLMTRPDGRLK